MTFYNVLSYYDGSDYNNITLIPEDINQQFNLIINSDLVILKNGTVLLSTFSTIVSKKGLSEVKFYCNAGAGANYDLWGTHTFIKAENIGIFSNGTSISDDFYHFSWDFNKDWDSFNHSIFRSHVIGNFSITANTEVLYPRAYYSEKLILSVYDWFGGYGEGEIFLYLEDCNLTITTNEAITFNYFYIDGIRLVENDNRYNMVYNGFGVNSNNSYFYVDSNNRLQFNLDTNDGGLEYIEASFDVENVALENRSVAFKSNLNGDSSGFLRLNYTDETSTFLGIPTHATTTSIILPQEKSLDTFIILVSDLDTFESGSTTGHITDIKLIYVPDIVITITTISILDVMIPLMILLIPTFAVYKKFGEDAIIPMFILMSVVCLVAELIPAWLFVVLMVGSVIMLFTKKKIEGA